MINFNKAYISQKEIEYVKQSLQSRKLSGDGPYTKLATNLLQKLQDDNKVLLTTSCTDALEMSALLLDIGPDDEIIVPSYTFVSTALAFEMRGAKIIFADSENNRPHISINSVKKLITPKTKAIVPVHYAGDACDMVELKKLTSNTNIHIIEDNAQGIGSTLYGKPLGTFGTLSTLSFHDSKNIVCGEGGALTINDPKYIERAEIMRDKGTNRSQFFRGEVNKYGWMDIGSSYLPSDILAAVLTAQLENITYIQSRRMYIWNRYMAELQCLNKCGIILPTPFVNAKNNGHIFYLICENLEQRTKFIEFMKQNGIMTVFHYLSLHKSDYFKNKYVGEELVYSDKYTDCLVRLPIFIDLTDEEVGYIISKTKEFFKV